MLALLKALAYPILSLILLILGSGLFTTFVSIRLELGGASNEMIGLVASAFYGGILVGSLRTPHWIARTGHLRALVALCAASCMLILLQALWYDPIYWGVLRFLGGVAMGGLFVVIESWFLLLSTKATRGQSLSIYLAVFYAALSCGQLLIEVSDPHSLLPYCIAGALSVAAILPIVVFPLQVPSNANSERFSLVEIFRASPRGFLGGVISGMLLSCIYGLAPVYGQESGLTISEIGTFMSVIVFGGLSLQWPLGKWADCSSRRGVLILACFAASLMSALIGVFDGSSWPLLLSLSWLFGGFSFVLYPLSMAFTCEGIEEHKIVAATGGFVVAYGIGAIAGPLLAPLFMNWFGSAGLFYFISGICALLGAIGSFPNLNYQEEK